MEMETIRRSARSKTANETVQGVCREHNATLVAAQTTAAAQSHPLQPEHKVACQLVCLSDQSDYPGH
jgi:hypothetical protein